MKKYKIGIIGCGFAANGAGTGNQIHMPSLSRMKDEVELVAFCDLIKEKAEASAREFGSDKAKIYTDYKELLNDDKVFNLR